MRKNITLLIVVFIFILIFFGCENQNFIKEEFSQRDYPASIMVYDVLYYDTNEIIENKIDNSNIIGYTASYTDEIPKKNGQTNFIQKSTPYAKYKMGIAVQNESGKWVLFERQKCFSE